MDIPVMLEQVSQNGYRATAMFPGAVTAEAPTRDEAVDKLRTILQSRLSRAELIHVAISVAAEANPWLKIAGTWRNHPDVDEVEENIRTYRQEVQACADRL